MKTEGERVRLGKWIYGETCAVHVQVEGVIPVDDPTEPCLEPDVCRYLDGLQELANAGNIAELGKHGAVYVRQAVQA